MSSDSGEEQRVPEGPAQKVMGESPEWHSACSRLCGLRAKRTEEERK